MPHRIPFTVVFASGEEQRHPANELNRHDPTVRGWQSARNCKFPQELVLRLQNPAYLRRVQVLAHQCLIPERIELWVGVEDSWRDGAATEVQNGAKAGETAQAEDPDGDQDEAAESDATPFQYLGFITLSDNQGTGFKSRELKSVSVPPCAGSYLKIRLHRNHPNQYNRYNQVGLIAVNIFGDDADAERNGKATCASPSPGAEAENTVSPYEDLAFAMYVDEDAARIIREMEARKLLAVQAERFEYARKLKAAQAQLHAAGERLARMTLDKRAAITAEDYGRARTLKTTIDQLRHRLYSELAVEDLLEKGGPLAKNDESPDEETDAGGTKQVSVDVGDGDGQTQLADQRQMAGVYSPRGGLTPTPGTPAKKSLAGALPESSLPRPIINPPAKEGAPSVRGSQRRRFKSAPATSVHAVSGVGHTTSHSAGGGMPSARSSYEAHEERMLPALRHGPLEPDHSEDRPRSKLNERERKQAALPISVFGVEMVEKFYSKHFADKEEGLRRLKNVLLDAPQRPPQQPNKMARAAIFLLHRALRDKVFVVYSLAAEVIRLFFTTFVPDRVSPAEVGRSVDRLLPELLLKSGDSTPRIHNMAVHTILSMADVEQVRNLHVIPATLTRPLQSATHPRLALSRLEMVEQLIINHGISQDKHSGMTCRALAELGAQGLQHPSEPARKVAERILVLVYGVNPRLVRKQLPPDDDITRRNLLYRQLFTDFDAIDVQRKREMQERQRDGSSGTGSPPTWPSGTAAGSTMSASWHNSINAISPAASPRPGVRRSTTGTRGGRAPNGSSANIMTTSMCASWTNGTTKSESSSSSGSAASPVDPEGGSVPGNESSSVDGDLKTCEFCGAASESFATDEGLNSHYWRACPLLTRCNECQQVVEIACLAVHLTEECELRALYRRCGACTEAVPLQRMQLHVTSCVAVAARHRRCPLCRTDVADGDPSWRAHLMGPTAKLCAAHPRLKHARSVRSAAPVT